MTIKAYNVGSIALTEIRTEFGGPNTNISLYSYRAGASLVAAATNGFPKPNGIQTSIASASNISMNGFYGSSGVSYSIAASPLSINEGSSIFGSVNTINVPNGTTLYWRVGLPASGINSAQIPDDFSGATSGSVVINSNQANFIVTMAVDNITEPGTETFNLILELTPFGPPSGIVATSSFVSINDTSQSPSGFVFNDVVASNLLTGYNLRTRAVAAGWNGTAQLMATITINSGVYVVGQTTSIAGFSTGSPTVPTGSTITLTNNGIIAGLGGAGGAGGNANDGSLSNGSSGGVGGLAFLTDYSISVYNNGTIGAGGGGGGGGSSAYWNLSTVDPKTSVTTVGFQDASGGGGGGGQSNGIVGANGSASGTTYGGYGPDVSATNGSLSAGGAGSSSSNVGPSGPDSGRGGAGGSFGVAGASGTISSGDASARSTAGAGGVAGSAIVGGANITWYAHNIRLGSYDSLGTNTAPSFGNAGQASASAPAPAPAPTPAPAPAPTPAPAPAPTPPPGGGGSGSVSVTAFMPLSFKRAGQLVPGDELVLMNAARDSYITGPVITNRTSLQKLLRMTSSSGITLTCSDNTPLTLQDGSAINSTEALGVQLPVMDSAGFRWEEIVALEPAGNGYVATIFCDNQCYAAGDEVGRFIFTHNVDQIKA